MLRVAKGFSILLVIYAALRAWSVPVVYDEVFTFTHYVITGGFQPFYSLLDANNHVVNSGLTHVSFLVFGGSKLALRLPNLLALLIYLFFLIRMKEMFSDKWLWMAFFIAVTMIHYLFDFFSLSRGYGLSFAFLTAATHYAWKFGKTQQLIHYGLALAALSLSLWSNLALMIPIVSLGGLLSLYLLTKGDDRPQYRAIGGVLGLLIFMIPVLYAALFSLKLKEHGRLYLGDGVSAWDAIGAGLAHTMLGISWAAYVAIGAIALYVILLGYAILRNQWTWKAILSTAVFILAVAGVFALHTLLDVNYPIRRTAMHLPFLMLVSVFTILDGLPKLIRLGAGCFIASFMALNFGYNLNLNHALDWRYECVPRPFVERIAQFEGSIGRKPFVSCDGFMNYLIGYQIPTVNGGFYSDQLQNFPSKRADLLIAHENMKWEGLVQFDTIDFNEQTGITLMQRKQLTNWTVVHETSQPSHMSSTSTGLAYIDSIEHLIGKSLAIEVEMTASSTSYPVLWSIYAQVWHSESESIFSSSLDMSATHYDLRKSRTVSVKSEFITLPKGADHLRIFAVSNNNRPITLSDIRVSVMADESIQ